MIAAALLVVAAAFPAQQAGGFSCPSVLGDVPLESQASYLDSQAPGSPNPGFRQFECFYRGEVEGETKVALVQANFDVSVLPGSECDPPGRLEQVEGGDLVLHSLTHWAEVRYDAHTTASAAAAGDLADAFLAEAERRALSCDGDEGAAPPEDAAVPAAATDDDEPTDEALTIAAGLILMLLGGIPLLRGPQGPKPGESGFDALAREQIADNLGAHADDLRPLAPPPQPTVPEPEPPAEREPEPPPDMDVGPLNDFFAAEVERRWAEGYFVRNPTLVKKIWNNLTNWDWSKGGQCGEFAEWGVEWTRDWIKENYGQSTQVEKLVVHERSTLDKRDLADRLDAVFTYNHAATRVILPDGRRFVLDYWEHGGRSWSGKRRIIPEEEWVKKWRAEVSEGVVERSTEEQNLRKWVHQFDQDRAFAALRAGAKEAGDPIRAEVIIRSWLRDPW